MKRILLLLTVFLSACSVTVPPRDNAQWTTTVLDTSITWRWVNPGGLGGTLGGYAISSRWWLPTRRGTVWPDVT